MNEIEVKIFNVNKKRILKTLLQLGAKNTFSGLLSANFYERLDNPMSPNERIRLRTNGKETVLTYKKVFSKGIAKTAQEIEVNVSDFDSTNQILNNVGFVTTLQVHKHRESYDLEYNHKKIKVEFDKYVGVLENIPEFMEIEADSEKTVVDFAKKLGYDKKDLSNENMMDLIKMFCPHLKIEK